MNPSKIAVLVAGCGHLDGAEINETVMTLLALRLQGLKPEAFGINKPLADTLDHLLRQPQLEAPRNGLREAARILRGDICDISHLNPSDFSGLAIPGGFGVAKNFCSFATDGKNAEIQPEIENVLSQFIKLKRPILAVCIAPALVGLVARKLSPPKSFRMTLGLSDNSASQVCREMGHEMVSCPPEACVVDPAHKLVTTPAFMHDTSIETIWPGINKAVSQFSEMISIDPSRSRTELSL